MGYQVPVCFDAHILCICLFSMNIVMVSVSR